MRHAAMILVAAFGIGAGQAVAVEQGDDAPAWQARGFDYAEYRFPALTEGKPIVVVFWATWCSYCRAFMPYLRDIQADYAQAGVKIVAINAKEDGSGNPRAYVAGLGFEPIAIADGDAIAQLYGVEFIPGLLVVDGTNRVAYRRPWTDLPAGRTVAEIWDGQVRQALDAVL